jgi:DNA transformation protein and related proteins
MEMLSQMSNIGRQLEKKFELAGINTPAVLREVGSKNRYLRISSCDQRACLSMLCALVGAIRGIRRHNLPKEVKSDLCEFSKLKMV